MNILSETPTTPRKMVNDLHGGHGPQFENHGFNQWI